MASNDSGWTFGGNLKHAFNALLNREQEPFSRPFDYGAAYGSRPDRVRYRTGNDRSIVAAIYTRLAIDIASVGMYHVRLDDQKRYAEDIDSGLNNCLTVEANLDQSGFAFRLDYVLSLFDEGTIALVPIDTTDDPRITRSYDILTMRVGKILQWYPQDVRVEVYNELTGRREQLVFNKRNVAIVENPLYSVMNEPNSTLQRLIRKLALLDGVDEQTSSGKLDLIIQLPYVIKSDQRRAQAEQRRKDIESQLKGSQYGIAYTDGTEKITQLNRGAENQLLKQVEYLRDELYNHLGLTKEVMNGTADEKAMLNYMDRTVEPIIEAFASEIRRKFLTKTARTQGQTIMFFKDPFKLVPMGELAEIADKFTRNEIISSNEMRGFLRMRPANDPRADELRNSNMPDRLLPPVAAPAGDIIDGEVVSDSDDLLEESLAEIEAAVADTFDELGIDPDEE